MQTACFHDIFQQLFRVVPAVYKLSLFLSISIDQSELMIWRTPTNYSSRFDGSLSNEIALNLSSWEFKDFVFVIWIFIYKR